MEMIKSLNLIDSVGLTIIILGCSYLFTACTKVATPLENKYLPFISMLFGIILGCIVGYVLHEDIGRACLAGFLIGGFTSGLYTGVKGVSGGYAGNSKEIDSQAEPIKAESIILAKGRKN